MEFSEVIKILLAFVLGGLVGLEREINEKRDIGKSKPTAILGIRSFALIGALGAVSAFLYTSNAFFGGLIAGAFVLLLLLFYVFDSRATKDFGITTEIAAIFTFLIGILLALDALPIQIILAISVLLIVLLSKKDEIKSAVEDIKTREIDAFISYLIIALVILPFLPNESYALSDAPNSQALFENFGLNFKRIAAIELFNPFKTWLIVALITGVNMLGYILERTLGKNRGWIVASIAGGFVSSTATIQSLAQEAKKARFITHILIAAIIANAVSFIQIAFIIGPLNAEFLLRLAPMLLALFATSFGIIAFLWMKNKKDFSKVKKGTGSSSHEMFAIVPALKFAGLYLTITTISKIALEFFGQAGFLITSAIGALTGIDAVMINAASLAGGKIDYTLAIWAFVIANAVNLIAKTIYTYIQGGKRFATEFGSSMMALIAVSIIVALFVL